jgi:uncharacterized repeat protein (TIGR03803 family)
MQASEWKIPAKAIFPIHMLIAALGLALANSVSAQVLTTLHSFTPLIGNAEIGQVQTNSDGATPDGTLILSGNTLYGTADYGGIWGAGTLFALNTNGGASFTPLYSFTGGNDGGYPESGVIISGGILYGTTESGGTGYNGTLFSFATNGTNLTPVHDFYSAGDGGSLQASVILSSNTLYGTASSGGSGIGDGTVFAVSTDGTNFVPLYSFSDIEPPGTNRDGSGPTAPLILSGTNLYGVASGGGPMGGGTVFSLSLDGTVFTTLHGFTGNDGAAPSAGLVLSGNTLYGTTLDGGASGEGTVFALNTNGGGFTNLYSFSRTAGLAHTNSDGAVPSGPLVLSGNTLYGTARQGGRWGSGTIFALNTNGTGSNGTGFATVYSFSASVGSGFSATNSDGVQPSTGLVISGNTLYGTAEYGGTYGNGTVFSLSLGPASTPPPQLTFVRAGTNVIVTWPASDIGFTLQSTTNLASPAVWSTVAGQFTVTNPIAGTAMFYRLGK